MADESGGPSAALSELAPRELGGLCRTNDLARVAPAELALLARSTSSGARHLPGRAAGRAAAVDDVDGTSLDHGDSIGEGGGVVGDSDGGDRGDARRRLFLRRLSERQLLGYALLGWADSPGRPLPTKTARLPRTTGGPLVICL